MWKVIIADDERLICRLIESLIDWETLDMVIVGKAENGLEALRMVKELQPHLLITDICMPGCDGLDLIRQARELSPDIEIVIISGYAYFEYAKTAIAYGVGSYSPKPVNQAELDKTLQKIALRLEERQENETTRSIRTAKQFIQENYGRNFTLEDVCKAVGFSSAYFSTLFKKETEEGFSKYLTQVRMDRAKELLRETSLPVAEVCEAVGYSDRKHFAQTFHKMTGVNPAEFRRLYGWRG